VSLAQLVDEPWILSPIEMEQEAPVGEAFRAIGIQGPRATIWSQSLNLRTNLLATGRFLTFVPGSVLRFGQRRSVFKVLPIKLPRWRLPIAVITLKGRTTSPVAQLFIDCVHKLAEPFMKARCFPGWPVSLRLPPCVSPSVSTAWALLHDLVGTGEYCRGHLNCKTKVCIMVALQ